MREETFDRKPGTYHVDHAIRKGCQKVTCIGPDPAIAVELQKQLHALLQPKHLQRGGGGGAVCQ